ncbi:MAG: 6-phosphogluconolactonase [Actinobacteria bacterium RBG_16_64_13]|nr:MAG: 6-phosphogluconolactonase [Actinobacteria bacterium RBG_16_64_13]
MVVVHPDAESLAWAAAALFVEEARRAVETRGCFTVALSGGSSPERMYQLLARPPFSGQVSWAKVHVFWSDERCVDVHDPRSNESMARKNLLDHVPIAPGQIHPMRCRAGAGANGPRDASSSADDYEHLLRSFLGATRDVGGAWPSRGERGKRERLDFVLLGVGTDGHTASLFPGSDALRETERWVTPVIAGDGPGSDGPVGAGPDDRGGAGRGLWRISLTASFINKAASVLFLASGRAKAAVVGEVLEGPIDPERLPAQLVRPQSGTVVWYLDDDSAALLAGRSSE